MTKGSGHDGRASPRELTVAILLLAALPAIVVGLVLARGGGKQRISNHNASPRESREDAAEEIIMQPQYARGPSTPSPRAGAEMTDLIALLPRPEKQSPFHISAAPKQWSAEQMHEKINGEDVVYIDAGCLGLGAMTLANASGMETIDLYLFQMKTPDAARDVFTAQAPDENASKPSDRPNYIDLGDKAYTTYGSCYLHAGRFYLKVMVNGESKSAAAAAIDMARKFAKKHKEHQ